MNHIEHAAEISRNEMVKRPQMANGQKKKAINMKMISFKKAKKSV